MATTITTPERKYMAFMDESGVSNLNDKTSDFWMSVVIIQKSDFAIIEGYLRLLKRTFLNDDLKILHACDLFEKTSTAYPELATARQTNLFLTQLSMVLTSVPYVCRVYFVDKNAIRSSHGYTSARGKKPSDINLELPYLTTSKKAIEDFSVFLAENNSYGEMMIESRMFNDAHFVSAFDDVRKSKEQKRFTKTAVEARNRITSLHVSSKNHHDGGLELADLCAYVTMRHERVLTGPSSTKIDRVTANRLGKLYSPIKKHSFMSADEPSKRLLYRITP